MYAVVSSGGKQYRVEAGSTLEIERLAAEPGASVTFDRVLLVGDGDEVRVGTPTVDGATVSATVLGETLGPKLVIFKFKQKVKYRRKTGHRQHLMRVRIDAINADGERRASRPSKAEKAEKPEKTAKTEKTATAEKAKAAGADEKPKARRTRSTKATNGESGTTAEEKK